VLALIEEALEIDLPDVETAVAAFERLDASADGLSLHVAAELWGERLEIKKKVLRNNYLFIHVYIYTYIHIYVYLSIYLYLNMYVYIHTHVLLFYSVL